MTKVLLTGGTGTLGRAVHRTLREDGASVRVMSRQPKPADVPDSEWATADLRSNVGVDAAVDGVDVIVHCATGYRQANMGRADVEVTKNLIAAARRSGTPHLVNISIVGIDDIPLFFYRAKHEIEDLVAAAELPWTTLRATQFHDLVLSMFTAQRFAPVLLTPAFSFQTIDVRDVALRLSELALQPAAGRVPDIGGPVVQTAEEMGRSYLAAFGRHRRVLSISAPGKTFAGYREGHNLTPNKVGTITFEEFLAERTAGR
ncbi:SDR family oxidoreductase [Antrihabitans sp. YC2-6]|uniref:SDR family oxidoreductase n=1 Tax=Antrihabitans sp. YC2-6 TaxID=2799498 RepID=UPI0018F60CC8|nr:SDR family oxidoreductase [Antrihabitans sp. YC2-6]MBJ8344177.1 SDR family oxidoreductase [Antrihabitans sp. YC2-6]